MTNTDQHLPFDEFKQLPHARLTGAVMLLCCLCMSLEQQQRITKGMEYLVAVINQSSGITHHLFSFTLSVFVDRGALALFDNQQPTQEILSQTLEQGAKALLLGAKQTILNSTEVRAYFIHLQQLAEVMLYSKDDKKNNQADDLLKALDIFCQSVG